LLAASQENGGLGNLDIVSLVSILSRLQGEDCAIVSLVSLVHLICLPLEKFNMVFYQKPFAGNNNSMEKPSGQSSLDGDQVIQLLNRMNSAFPSSQKVVAPSQGFDLNIAQSIQSPRADRSPSSSPPVVQNLFPLHSGDESRENDSVSVCKEDNLILETSPSNDRCSAYNLSKLESKVQHQNFMSRLLHQSSESRSAVVQLGYTSSSSGSEQSPASSNSESQVLLFLPMIIGFFKLSDESNRETDHHGVQIGK
jgi:hypothetical protein